MFVTCWLLQSCLCLLAGTRAGKLTTVERSGEGRSIQDDAGCELMVNGKQACHFGHRWQLYKIYDTSWTVAMSTLQNNKKESRNSGKHNHNPLKQHLQSCHPQRLGQLRDCL